MPPTKKSASKSSGGCTELLNNNPRPRGSLPRPPTSRRRPRSSTTTSNIASPSLTTTPCARCSTTGRQDAHDHNNRRHPNAPRVAPHPRGCPEGCGRKFGITGEVGEILVCQALGLRLVKDPRSQG